MNMADEIEGGLPEEATVEEIEVGAEEVSQEEPAEAQEGDDPNNPGEDSDDFVELLIGDKAEKLSKAEIAQRMMLHGDYTRKTQALAEEKRGWETQVNEARQAIASELTELKSWLEFKAVHADPVPDFAALAAEKGPAAAYQAELQWRKEQGQREQAKTILEQIRHQETARVQASFEADVRREFPQWSDPVKANAELPALYDAARHYGFSRDEVLGTQDVRTLKILSDLARLRALDAKKPGIAAKVAEVQKQTPVRSAPASADGRKAADARKAFEKNPTIESAARLLNF